MIDATKRWLRRNRTNFAIGFGVIGITYVTGQYVSTKIAEARERLTGDRLSKENLRRRFQQNQDDCIITVLELLPTVSEAVIEALPSEKIAEEIQKMKRLKSGKSAGPLDGAPSEFSSNSTGAMAEEDGRSLASESYVHASQTAGSDSGNVGSTFSKSKSQLWAELKISSMTRLFTLLYTASLLSLFTRIQLNILGRKNYLSSVVSMASYLPHDPKIDLENRDDDNVKEAYGNDFETNRKFLTFSWWLLHRGWRDVMSEVDSAVREFFGPLKPTEDISIEKMSSLILNVRKAVEGKSEEDRRLRKWLSFLLPPQGEEQTVLSEVDVSTPPSARASIDCHDPSSMPSPLASPKAPPVTPAPLRRLLDETADFVDSPMFTHVLTLLLDTSFSHLADIKLRSETYKLHPLGVESSSESRIAEVNDVDPADVSTKLATVLAFMTREAHKISSGVPNEYVQAIEGVSELEGFAAVIYSSNLEVELGIEANSSPYMSRPGSDDRAGKEKDTATTAASESEGPLQVETDQGILGTAGNVLHAAYGGFESVWSRVAGRY